MNLARDILLTIMILIIIVASWLIIPFLAIILVFLVTGCVIFFLVSEWFDEEPKDPPKKEKIEDI